MCTCAEDTNTSKISGMKEWDLEYGCEGGKMTVLERPARVYFLKALSFWRQGYILRLRISIMVLAIRG